jgi:hypothetical protein
MSELRKLGVAAWNLSCAIGLLGHVLALYASGYYATVRRAEIIYSTVPMDRFVPRYSRNGLEPYLEIFFLPIHQFDCYLRPEVWDPKNP